MRTDNLPSVSFNATYQKQYYELEKIVFGVQIFRPLVFTSNGLIPIPPVLELRNNQNLSN